MASKSLTSLPLYLACFILILVLSSETSCGQSPSPTSPSGTCPDGFPLRLGACTNVLSLDNIVAGDPRTQPCCSPMVGLANVQIADCLCFLFGKIPVVGGVDEAVRTIFFACNEVFPLGFRCP